MDYEWIEKTILKKSDKKIRKKNKINVEIPHVNKKTTSEKIYFKQKTWRRMSCEWIGKTI